MLSSPSSLTRLFCEELRLDEVAHLGISMRVGHLVEVQQRLVHRLLQLERGAGGHQRRPPVVLRRLHDGLQHHPTAALVLELHQRLGVLPLLVRGFLEEGVQAREGDVVPVEEGGLWTRGRQGLED